MINQKKFFRVALAIAIVIAIGVSLWYASPTQALQVTITPPANGHTGDSHNFTVRVTIEDAELLPLTQINMYIYKSDNRAGYEARLENLPANTDIKVFTSNQTGDSGAATVNALAGPGWSYTFGTGQVTWEGNPPVTWPGVVGGYAYGAAGSYIEYNVAWDSPGSWPSGNYVVETKLITVDSTTFTKTSNSFRLTRIVGGGGGGGGGGGVPSEPPPSLLLLIDGKGSFFDITVDGIMLETAEVTSDDKSFTLTVPEGTKALDSLGERLEGVNMDLESNPPPPPPRGRIIGRCYNVRPAGATFKPAALITFAYDPATLPADVTEADLFVAYYDTVSREWVAIKDVVIDALNNKIIAKTTHLTDFAVIIFEPPAPAFTTRSLVISPPEVNIGEPVRIVVSVVNSGNLDGSYNIALTINNEVVDTRQVAVPENSTKDVVFSVAKDTAGTYNVSVDTLTGKFVVKAPAPPTPAPTPTPAPPTQPTTLPPTPAPTQPAPTPTPTQPASTAPPTTPTGFPWWLLIVVLAAMVLSVFIAWRVINYRRQRAFADAIERLKKQAGKPGGKPQ